MKKVTLKDIALEANVSVATVSYIINNVKTQTIPKETKERVLRIAKKLNYVPNLAARSLVKQKTGLVGILVCREENQGFWRRFHYAELISELEGQLAKQGFHVVLYSLDAANPNPQIILERKLDGVFLIDPSMESFHNISRQFPLVPLVVIDSSIDDPLFFKVMPDFKSALEKTVEWANEDDFVLVIEKFNNVEMIQTIKDGIQLKNGTLFLMDNEENLAHFLKIHEGKKAVVVNEFIGALVSKYMNPNKLAVICTSGCPEILPNAASKILFTNSKSEAASVVMLKMLNGEEVDEVEKYIFIKIKE